MNHQFYKLSLLAGRIDRRHIQLFLLLLSLSLLVIGAGAPVGGGAGDPGHGGYSLYSLP